VPSAFTLSVIPSRVPAGFAAPSNDLYVHGRDEAPLVAEVKARQNGAGFARLEKWLGNYDALFLRRDRADALVVLPWRVWADLIQRAKRPLISPRSCAGTGARNSMNSCECRNRGRPHPAKQRSANPMSDNRKNDESNLPVPVDDDFGAGGNSERLIQGTILRCVDGHWSDRDGVSYSTGTEMLVLGTMQALQHWQDGMPIETITIRPFPDLDELNSSIPEDQWEEGLDGKPPKPWVLQHVAYLLDPHDASMFTFINSTTGAQIAVERLTSKVRAMRMLRGQRVSPIVKLDSKPMPTKFGEKMRPEFVITEWRNLDDGGQGVEHNPTPQLPPGKATEQIGTPVKSVTTAEAVLMDCGSMPFLAGGTASGID